MVFDTSKSANGVIWLVSVAVLLLKSESLKFAGAFTVAVLLIAPVASLLNTPVMVNVTDSPASRLTKLSRLPTPSSAPQLEFSFATQVQRISEKALGIVSVTRASLTRLDPRFVTVMV